MKNFKILSFGMGLIQIRNASEWALGVCFLDSGMDTPAPGLTPP